MILSFALYIIQKEQKEFSKDNKYACHTKEKVIELFYNGFEILI